MIKQRKINHNNLFSHYEQSVKEIPFGHLLKNERISLREKHVCSLTIGKSSPSFLEFTVRKIHENDTIFVLIFSFNPYMSEQ